MNQKFTYNFTRKEIVGSKASINKANKGINPEYKELSEMLKAHPDFDVVEKVIKKNDSKKTYHHLTFNRMKDYIKTQPNADKNLELFDAIQKVADSKGAKYPLTKKWFLDTFPEYKKNKVTVPTEDETATTSDEDAEEIVNALAKEVA